MAIYIEPVRISGTGTLQFYTIVGGKADGVGTAATTWWIKSDTGVFLYRLTVANDDWDFYAYGYFNSTSETPSTATTTYTNGGSYILMVAIVLIVLVVAGGMRRK